MEIYILILLIVCIILGALAAGLLFFLVGKLKNRSGLDIEGAAIEAEGQRTRDIIVSALTATSSTIFSGVKTSNDTLVELLKKANDDNTAQILRLQDEVRRTLCDIRQDNEKQLTEMRIVVDEKLQSTLTERFNKAFNVIGERLEAVTKQMGEMQVLTNNVTDLNKMLSQVKTRGVWGEVALQGILQDMLHESQYEAQAMVKKGREKVDFVIKLPGQSEDDRVLLPIDCKFPIEDYIKLQEAAETANVAAVESARRALFDRIKEQCKSINDKYIDPPRTTNFAIIYLPTEGLYSEVVQNYALVQELQTRYHILPAGPTSIAALLNSLQLGFRTLQIQKKSLEIVNAFVVVKKEISSFASILANVEKQLATVTGTVQNASRKTRTIEKKFSKIELPESGVSDVDGEIGDE